MTAQTIEFTVDGVLNLLRSQGLRLTRSRRGIVRVLFQAGRPLSLTEIQTQAHAISKEMPNLATVFRMMVLLEKLHLVRKVSLRRSCSYFEISDPSRHYDHLVCTQCGKVERLSVSFLRPDAEEQIREGFGFRALHRSLEFFGWCPTCSEPAVSADVSTPVPA